MFFRWNGYRKLSLEMKGREEGKHLSHWVEILSGTLPAKFPFLKAHFRVSHTKGVMCRAFPSASGGTFGCIGGEPVGWCRCFCWKGLKNCQRRSQTQWWQRRPGSASSGLEPTATPSRSDASRSWWVNALSTHSALPLLCVKLSQNLFLPRNFARHCRHNFGCTDNFPSLASLRVSALRAPTSRFVPGESSCPPLALSVLRLGANIGLLFLASRTDANCSARCPAPAPSRSGGRVLSATSPAGSSPSVCSSISQSPVDMKRISVKKSFLVIFSL